MPVFRPLDETRLQDLDDAALIGYILDARAAEDRGSAEIALKIFAFGMEDAVRAFVRGRLGSHGETDIEEVIGRTLEDAIRSISNLRGSTPRRPVASSLRSPGCGSRTFTAGVDCLPRRSMTAIGWPRPPSKQGLGSRTSPTPSTRPFC